MEELFAMLTSPGQYECAWASGELNLRRVKEVPMEACAPADKKAPAEVVLSVKKGMNRGTCKPSNYKFVERA